MAERSEAEALAFFLQTWTEIEAKIKHVAERSDAEALAFLIQIWMEIEANINHMAERSEASRIFVPNLNGEAKIKQAKRK